MNRYLFGHYCLLGILAINSKYFACGRIICRILWIKWISNKKTLDYVRFLHVKKNSISFSETKNDYLKLYLHIGRRPHRIFMVSYEFNELFMLNDGKYQGKCSLSYSLLLSLHVLLRLIHTEGNWKRTRKHRSIYCFSFNRFGMVWIGK